jgi:hypothetical protein
LDAPTATANRGAMIPLYGCLEGDSLVLLIFAYEDESILTIRDKLQDSAALRVARDENANFIFRDHIIDLNKTVREVGLEPLDIFYVNKRT